MWSVFNLYNETIEKSIAKVFVLEHSQKSLLRPVVNPPSTLYFHPSTLYFHTNAGVVIVKASSSTCVLCIRDFSEFSTLYKMNLCLLYILWLYNIRDWSIHARGTLRWARNVFIV